MENSKESFFFQRPADEISEKLLPNIEVDDKLQELSRPRSVYAIVDDALDEIGSGKLQAGVLAVTMSGQFIDAAEVMIIAIVMPILQVEWRTSESSLALIASLTALGMMVGSTLFGKLSDMYGRKLSYQWSLIICITFGFASSFAADPVQFAILRMILGIGYGGNMVACTTYLVEFAPNNYRVRYMSLSGLAFGLGSIFIVVLALGAMDQIGWRWIVRIASLVSLPILVGLYLLPESIRYYVSVGEFQKAEEGIVYLAKVNTRPVPSWFSKECLQQAHDAQGLDCEATKGMWGISNIVRTPYLRRNLLLMFSIWFLNSFASTVFAWIPLEISNYYPGSPWIKYDIALALAIGGFCGSIVSYFATMYAARLTVIRLATLGCATMTFVLAAGKGNREVLFVFSFLLEVHWTILISTMYLYTPEIFPTPIRVSCFGVAQFGHRFAPTLAPFAIVALNQYSFSISCVVLGSVYAMSLVLTCFLNVETFKRRLVEYT